jgi:hypothetical protein
MPQALLLYFLLFLLLLLQRLRHCGVYLVLHQFSNPRRRLKQDSGYGADIGVNIGGTFFSGAFLFSLKNGTIFPLSGHNSSYFKNMCLLI